MDIIVLGIVTGFNLLIILKKIGMGRGADAAFDTFALVILTLVFGGTLGGMMVATVASAFISIMLLANPSLVDFSQFDVEDEEDENGLTSKGKEELLSSLLSKNKGV